MVLRSKLSQPDTQAAAVKSFNGRREMDQILISLLPALKPETSIN